MDSRTAAKKGGYDNGGFVRGGGGWRSGVDVNGTCPSVFICLCDQNNKL